MAWRLIWLRPSFWNCGRNDRAGHHCSIRSFHSRRKVASGRNECAYQTARAIAAGDKREGAPAETPWTKVKFDRQIVAIAIVNGASEIISDDPHVKALGERWGIRVTSVDDLPIPEELIPPPLLAVLEEVNEEKPEPVRRGDDGQGGAESTEGTQGKEGGE